MKASAFSVQCKNFADQQLEEAYESSTCKRLQVIPVTHYLLMIIRYMPCLWVP